MPLSASAITSLLETAFATTRPISGYWVNLIDGGVVVCRAQVTKTNPGGVDGVSTANVSFTISSETWYAMIFPAGSSAGGGLSYLPKFQVVDASSGGAAKVTVTFGQVNSITPTIGGTSIAAGTPPTLAIGSGTARVVYLRFEIDPSDWSNVGCIIAEASSLPADDNTYGYLTLAEVDASGSAVTAIRQSVLFSLQHDMVGNGAHEWCSV